MHPWFSDTGIIEPLLRLGLVGLPMASVSDVVDAMASAATDPDVTGTAYVVDTKVFVFLFMPLEQLFTEMRNKSRAS